MKKKDRDIYTISSNLILDISTEIMDGFREIALRIFKDHSIKR